MMDLLRFGSVLAIGAHADDVEIGCGGTLRALFNNNPHAQFHIALFSGDEARRDEARHAASSLVTDPGRLQFSAADFRDGYFPAEYAAVKDFMHELQRECQPDVVLVHRRQDAHQDHRTLGELAGSVFRRELILEYEIPKYDGDLTTPNVYVPLTREDAEHKVQTIWDSYPSQRARDWFTPDTFWALLRLRGVECHAPSGFAEGFTTRKVTARIYADDQTFASEPIAEEAFSSVSKPR